MQVAGNWRKLHNEELHEFFPSANTTWMIKWVGHVASMR
jgi:hypothetical protein